ncbi:MAG: hypothetical protein ACKVIX_01460 [Sphingomonadales bacterium]
MEINKIGDVFFEGHKMGQLQGFSFYSEEQGTNHDQKSSKKGLNKQQTLEFENLLKEEVTSRVKALVSADEPPLKLDTALGLTKPRIALNGIPIAYLQKGDRYLFPKIKLMPNSLILGIKAEDLLHRLTNWMGDYITMIAPSLAALEIELNGNGTKLIKGEKPPVPLTGMARGIAFRLLEHQGILPRYLIEEDLRKVEPEARKGLWRFRIKIGASTLFVPNLLKPASTELRISLWALDNNIETLPPVPTPGMVWCEVDRIVPSEFYRISGFRKAGNKAIRVDMIERLADAVRNLGHKGNEFDVTPEIMGLVGLSGDDFVSVMNSIGYKSRKKEVPPPQVKTDEKLEESLKALEKSEPPIAIKDSDSIDRIEKDFFKWVAHQDKSKPQRHDRNVPNKERELFNKSENYRVKTTKKPEFKLAQKVEETVIYSNPFAALKSLKVSMELSSKTKGEKGGKPTPTPKK